MFRSDPVLDFDRDGNFFYYSLRVEGGNLVCDTFRSTDGGQTWGPGVFSFGGDKAWVAVDRSGSIGDGHFYASWSPFAGCCGADQFNRSVDGASSFEAPVALAEGPTWGVVAVGPDGEVYVAGRRAATAGFVVARSTTIADPDAPLAFERSTIVDLGGAIVASAGPNPGGLLGQTWIAVDTSPGPRRGHVYLLASVDPAGADPLDVHFSRSTDAGATWSPPVRVNDDSLVTHAWQWFGMMSVAPDGRIDTIWNDTRDDPGGFDSVLYYASSTDGGATWSTGEPLTPPFDPHLGWPQQNKLGDYYDMVSNTTGVHIAYAATFNGEQDVYYLHLRASDEIFADAFESGDTSAWEP